MNILAERIVTGIQHYPPESPISSSVKKIRRLPNGRIDLLTIDETARLSANSINEFMQRGIFKDLDNSGSG